MWWIIIVYKGNHWTLTPRQMVATTSSWHGANRPRGHGTPGAAGNSPPGQGRLRHPGARRGVRAKRPRRVAGDCLRRAEAAGTEGTRHLAPGRQHTRARRPGEAVLQAETVGAESAPRIARDVPGPVARLRIDPGSGMNAAPYTEHTDIGGTARLLSRLIPAGERDAIVGDLLEDAAYAGLEGARLQWWLLGECGAIAAGLSIARVRAWFVIVPVREVVSGFAVDGRGVLRGTHPLAALMRALIFCGSLATIVLGVELLVGSLLSASGL